MADDWNGNANTLFTNVRILDGTGEYPFTGEVLVQGNRIKQITRGSSRFRLEPVGLWRRHDGHRRHGRDTDARHVDAHLHLSWNNAPGIEPIQMMELEEHMLVTMEMAKLVIDAGFTAGRGAAAAKPRLDVVPSASSTRAASPVRAIWRPAPRSPPSAAWAIPRPPTFRTRGSISVSSFPDRRKSGASCARLSNTASTPSS